MSQAHLALVTQSSIALVPLHGPVPLRQVHAVVSTITLKMLELVRLQPVLLPIRTSPLGTLAHAMMATSGLGVP